MNIQNKTKDSSRKSVATFVCALACAIAAASANAATRVTVVGLFPGKAVVSIDGKDPRTISIGEKTGEGVKLVATTSDSATLEIDGKRHTLDVGQMYAATGQSSAPDSGGSGRTINLAADGNGHFLTFGQINGRAIQFLVDTGATSVSIPAPFAQEAGIDYKKGQRQLSQTANGVIVVYRVKLDSVRVGDVTLYQVDAVVIDGKGMNTALLGMSFLNRMEMKREGTVMTLTKRF